MADKVVTNVSNTDSLWWLGVLGGVLTMLFGIAALFWPALTLTTFVYLFSAYVLVWGVVSIVKGFVDMTSARSMWWLQLLFGFFAVGAGIYLVRHPLASFTTLILIAGFTFIIRGAIDAIGGIFGDAQSSTGRTLSIIAGVLGVIAGIYLLMQPVSGGIAFVWIVGLYALLFGPLLIALAIDAHNLESV